MLPIYNHRNFKKQFKRLPKKIQDKFGEKIIIFLADVYSIELNNHLLTGEWAGYRSIDITGDIRAVYKIENNCYHFRAVGTHHQLYGK